jgi:hypothetical protein
MGRKADSRSRAAAASISSLAAKPPCVWAIAVEPPSYILIFSNKQLVVGLTKLGLF